MDEHEPACPEINAESQEIYEQGEIDGFYWAGRLQPNHANKNETYLLGFSIGYNSGLRYLGQ